MDHRIRSAMERIHRRFDRRLTVAEMAGGVNLSVSRFTHLFRAYVGTPPSRYLKRVRMRAARRLLETTFLSVKEVMARVGLNDASHFVRDFKRHHHVRPGQVRRAAGGGQGGSQQKRPTDSASGQRRTA
jgi:AraC family transcriptional regulator of arabinose operon